MRNPITLIGLIRLRLGFLVERDFGKPIPHFPDRALGAGGAGCGGLHHPILFVESTKTAQAKPQAWFENIGYSVSPAGTNFMAIHKDDKCLANFRPRAAVSFIRRHWQR